jgi:hypothetical protein
MTSNNFRKSLVSLLVYTDPPFELSSSMIPNVDMYDLNCDMSSLDVPNLALYT